MLLLNSFAMFLWLNINHTIYAPKNNVCVFKMQIKCGNVIKLYEAMNEGKFSQLYL